MAANASDIIASLRDQIPDTVSDNVAVDGTFSRASLLRWLNDAGRIICTQAPVIVDWSGVPSQLGMDTYELENIWISVEQGWYDLLPLTRTAELDDLFTSKITARSWWFGQHSLHATPKLHVWPACDRTASITTLATAMGVGDNSFNITESTGFRTFGLLKVESEIILYRNVSTTVGTSVTTGPATMTNILRAQGGSVAVAHPAGAIVTELNITYKGVRTPRPLTAVTDPIEVPQGIWPLLEMYVLSRVREAEQDHMTARTMLQDFNQMVNELANKLHNKAGHHQGLQVRHHPPGPQLFRGRVYIP